MVNGSFTGTQSEIRNLKFVIFFEGIVFLATDSPLTIHPSLFTWFSAFCTKQYAALASFKNAYYFSP